MVSTVHSFSTILLILTLLLSTRAAHLPAYPLVRTVLSASVFYQMLSISRLCATHICRVSADFEIFYNIYD